jgi:hypothetical protein
LAKQDAATAFAVETLCANPLVTRKLPSYWNIPRRPALFSLFFLNVSRAVIIKKA